MPPSAKQAGASKSPTRKAARHGFCCDIPATPSNTTASPATADATSTPGRSVRASSRVARPASRSRFAVTGPGHAASVSHPTGTSRRARPATPVAVRIDPPIASRAGAGSGRVPHVPSPSSIPRETPNASKAENRMAAITPRSARERGRTEAGAGPPNTARTRWSEIRWSTPTQPLPPPRTRGNQSLPSGLSPFPVASCDKATTSGRISTAPTVFAAIVTAAGMRDRARANAAVHVADPTGRCGKVSVEKTCHPS